jgi:hypothetical protein
LVDRARAGLERLKRDEAPAEALWRLFVADQPAQLGQLLGGSAGSFFSLAGFSEDFLQPPGD